MASPAINKTTCMGGTGSRGDALLVTRDNLAGKWAPTWLQHAGLEVRRASTPAEAVQMAKRMNLSLVIADSGLLDIDGTCLLKRLMEISGPTTVVIGLCSNQAELDLAQDANASGSFPAPYDWQAITRQCVRLVVARDILQELDSAQNAIAQAQRHVENSPRRSPRSALQTKSPYSIDIDQFSGERNGTGKRKERK